METIEINGVKYAKIEKEPHSQKNYVNSKLLPLLMMTGMFSGHEYGRRQGSDGGVPDPKIDIIKEYGLIQLKKSNLTKAQRDGVVYTFEKNYKKVEEQ